MNRYQENLDFIVENSCPSHMSCKECHINRICNNLVKRHIDRLQELVDRATPKKLDYESDGYYDGELVYDKAYCPICHHEFEYAINDWGCDYCSDCGQALDWNCNYER